MNRIYKLISFFPILIIGCTPNVIEKNKEELEEFFEDFEHIVIDEAQDITEPRTTFINNLIEILPEGIIDFFGNTTDTLNYSFTTKKRSDYGKIFVNLSNISFKPIIVDLINMNEDIVMSKKLANSFEPCVFENIRPGEYNLRIIHDTNNNGNLDELYNTALEIVKSERKASTSFLQRKLQIGYNRAARIIDMMEEKGIHYSSLLYNLKKFPLDIQHDMLQCWCNFQNPLRPFV